MVGLVPIVVKMQVWSSLVTSPIQTSVVSHQDIKSHWFLGLTFSFALDLSFLHRWGHFLYLVFTSHTDVSSLVISFSRSLVTHVLLVNQDAAALWPFLRHQFPLPDNSLLFACWMLITNSNALLSITFSPLPFSAAPTTKSHKFRGPFASRLNNSMASSIFVQRIRPLAIPELSSILPFHGCL